jgi:hypothetical protein
MADNAILFKYLAKSVGMRHGVIPSFMAKPWGNVSCFLSRNPGNTLKHSSSYIAASRVQRVRDLSQSRKP